MNSVGSTSKEGVLESAWLDQPGPGTDENNVTGVRFMTTCCLFPIKALSIIFVSAIWLVATAIFGIVSIIVVLFKCDEAATAIVEAYEGMRQWLIKRFPVLFLTSWFRSDDIGESDLDIVNLWQYSCVDFCKKVWEPGIASKAAWSLFAIIKIALACVAMPICAITHTVMLFIAIIEKIGILLMIPTVNEK
jgi:hypothetical protein